MLFLRHAGAKIRLFAFQRNAYFGSVQKKNLLAYCQSLVQRKINDADAAMRAAQAAANEETKSSAGDKYETGRAIMHLEKEKFAHQRDEALKLKKVLDQIDPGRSATSVALGSLVQTDMGWFFVAVGLGSVTLDGQTCFVISPVAPIGRAMGGKRAGEECMFNQRTIKIIDVR